MDVDLRLDNGHQPSRQYIHGQFEPLGDDSGDALLVGLPDKRAHLRAEHAEAPGAGEERLQARDGSHEMHAVGFGLEPLVDLYEGDDPFDPPQILSRLLPIDEAIHGVFEEDGGQYPVPVERRAGHDSGAHLVHQVEHLGVIVVSRFGDPVGSQHFRGAAATLVQGCDEPRPRPDPL